jgi:hypothetical protein
MSVRITFGDPPILILLPIEIIEPVVILFVDMLESDGDAA